MHGPIADKARKPDQDRAARSAWDRIRSARLNRWMVWGLSLLLSGGAGVYFWFYEGVLPNQIFTTLVTLSLVAVLAAVTRRVLFSTVLVAMLIAAVTAISFHKRSQELMVLHAWDFWFYVPSVFTSAMKPEHLGFTLAFLAGALATAALAWLAWKVERPHLRRAWTALACVVLIAASVAATMQRPERRHTQFFWDDSFITSFYASWAEALVAWRRGNLVEAAATASRPPLRTDTTCAPGQKPPNIILIHEESVFEPSIFPQVEYDRRLDAFFRPPGGQHRSMRVETYGGGSWMTEFSIMTGLSAQSFGGMRGFLQTFMVNRLGDTLPQALERCGYRNVLFYPMLKVFISTAPFYNSIGVREIFDAKDQKAPTAWERDRFYFGNALAEMERHFATSKAPLFTFIQTMGTHWPYDVKHFADEDVPGGGPGAEINEFLRRLWLAKVDYDDMKRQLETRFPGERFLIVHYGDHHPMATRFLLGFKDGTEAEDIVLAPDSPGLVTYLALDGVRYTPLPIPRTEPVDAAYLGTLALTAAGLPLPDSMKERLRLLEVCKGRYYDCADRNEIPGFHRRLLDAGLLKPR